MKKFLVMLGLLAICSPVHAWSSPQAVIIAPSVNVSSANATAGGSVTATVAAPSNVGAYSSGYFNYVTNIHIEMYATGTLTGGATPVACTTTNLNGVQYYFPTAAATGTLTVLDVQYANPLQSLASSAVTVVCPATASVRWNVNVGSFSGQ